MGLLAPLYVAGLVAIGLPIVFHLIRRAPHGRQAFGSLMFLSATPPRHTRRSRLSNILLLLLRAAALALLAFAFARPFLRAASDTDAAPPRGRRVAILIDTSASMRRDDLWQQAVAHAEQTLADLRPEDEAALYFFDRAVRPAMGFAEWNELAPAVRVAAARARLAAASPGWGETRLGDALAAVADTLAEEEGARVKGADKAGAAAVVPSGRQLVLISDLQEGGRPEALQGHQWPASVLLQVKPVAPKRSANASLQLIEQTAGASDGSPAAAVDDRSRLRVRVTNQPGSPVEQFTLTWAGATGPVAGVEPQKVYVPAGRGQVVRVSWPPAAEGRPAADRLVLAGDDAPFDNTQYVIPPRQQGVRVLFVGDDTADDVNGLRYYLQGALAETPLRRVDLIARPAGNLLGDADLAGAQLVVVAAGLPDDGAARLRAFAEAGGDVLWVLRDAAAGAAGLARATGLDGVAVAEAAARDFALVGRIDLGHPLFAPFAAAHVADFTKIHFWKHRRLTLPDPLPATTKILAWFDDGSPFLVECAAGRGRVLVAASGWHPADSQFALSTKFVPFIDRIVHRRDATAVAAQQRVGERIPLPPTDGRQARTLLTPDGRKIDLALDETAIAPEAVDRPGIYRLAVAGAAGAETPLAVNLAAEESRTAAIDVEELERFGAKLGVAPTSAELVARQRRLRTAELEGTQKLWRWGIVCVLCVLAIETIVAGNLARRGRETGLAT